MTDRAFLRALFIFLISTGAIFLHGCATPPVADAEAGQKDLADKWGIRVDAIRLTAGNYMLDFRYRVLDAGKAARVIGPRTHPYLIDQTSGVRLAVPTPPKIGPLRQTRSRPVAGKSYFIFFANPGQYVKPGTKVTVVMNEMRIENLVVQ